MTDLYTRMLDAAMRRATARQTHEEERRTEAMREHAERVEFFSQVLPLLRAVCDAKFVTLPNAGGQTYPVLVTSKDPAADGPATPGVHDGITQAFVIVPNASELYVNVVRYDGAKPYEFELRDSKAVGHMGRSADLGVIAERLGDWLGQRATPTVTSAPKPDAPRPFEERLLALLGRAATLADDVLDGPPDEAAMRGTAEGLRKLAHELARERYATLGVENAHDLHLVYEADREEAAARKVRDYKTAPDPDAAVADVGYTGTEYELVIHWTREVDLDVDLVQGKDHLQDLTLDQALVQQFVREMQEAVEHEGNPPGSFQVVELIRPNGTRVDVTTLFPKQD